MAVAFICEPVGSPLERSANSVAVGIKLPLRGTAGDKTPRSCAQCGAKFIPYKLSGKQRRIGHVQRYCSRKCVDAARSANAISKRPGPIAVKCAVCGSEFVGRRGRRVCSDSCRDRLAADRAREYAVLNDIVDRSPRQCRLCGVVFSPVYGSKSRVFCSADCRRKEAKRVRKHRHRARHRGVAYEAIDPIKVFNRDGWRCQVCGCKTPKRLRGSIKHNAPELDHRVPMALGGGHTWANVQCCCRQCNSDKGSTVVVGQLPLFAKCQ